jgi:DNA-binding MurR/RpiR family transcriptional regulator
VAIPEKILAVLDAKFTAVLPHLDERQRRLYLAAEAEALGHGGIAAVARLAEVSESTIARGRDELAARGRSTGAGAPARRRTQAGDRA